MRWNAQIAHLNMRAAISGGVIATWDKEEAVVKKIVGASTRIPEVSLYSSDGTQIGHIRLDFGQVVDVQITAEETIVIATRPGLIRHYTEFGRNFVQLHLPASIEKVMLSSDGYVAALAPPESNSRLFRLAKVSQCSSPEPRFRIVNLAAAHDSDFHKWQCFPEIPDIGQTAGIMILDRSGKLHVYDAELTSSSHRIGAEHLPVGFISLSPQGDKVAFGDGKNKLVVFPLDFHENLLQCSETGHHSNIYWIGEETVLMPGTEGEAKVFSWRGVSTERDSLKTYFEDSEVALIQEVDGVRVIGTSHHVLFTSVERSTAETFKIGSVAPSSILYSCVDHLDAGSSRSDQTLKLLEPPKLARAVETCISAALLELDSKTQKRLMRAAALGKSMLEAYDSSRYLQSINKLRLLNFLRSLQKATMFITHRQLMALNIFVLRHRLELRGLWAEAAAVSELEGLPVEPVYIEWACWEMQNKTQYSDEELMEKLNVKLSKLGAFSHSKMALRALEQGRQKLALTLLEDEPVASDRVKLLLEMSMGQPALEQATLSGNPFLVDYVLTLLAEQLSTPQLMRALGGNQVAINRQIELICARGESKDSLHEFLYQIDHRLKSLQIEIQEVGAETDALKKVQMLRALENKFANLSKSSRSDSQACSEWADLIATQCQLEESYTIEVIGKSATDTVASLLKLSQISQAQKLSNKLGISERHFWWLRLRSLVDRREFDAMWDLGQQKKSPIGYRPFYDACYESGSMEYAAKFVELITDASTEEKVKMYIKTKHINKARELATKSKNPQILELLNG